MGYLPVSGLPAEDWRRDDHRTVAGDSVFAWARERARRHVANAVGLAARCATTRTLAVCDCDAAVPGPSYWTDPEMQALAMRRSTQETWSSIRTRSGLTLRHQPGGYGAWERRGSIRIGGRLLPLYSSGVFGAMRRALAADGDAACGICTRGWGRRRCGCFTGGRQRGAAAGERA